MQPPQFGGGFGMGMGGFPSQRFPGLQISGPSPFQFGQPPRFGGGFDMQQQPTNQRVGINYTPPVMDQRVRNLRLEGGQMPQGGLKAQARLQQIDARPPIARLQQQQGERPMPRATTGREQLMRRRSPVYQGPGQIEISPIERPRSGQDMGMYRMLGLERQ